MGDFLIGTTPPSAIYVGTSPLKELWVGTTKVWPSDIWTLFDSGYVNDIAWEAGTFTRPNYTANGYAQLNYVESNGYFRMYIYGAGSTYTHYAVISTATTIKVPRTATTINCQAWRESTSGAYLYLSLVPSDAPNCISTTNGGIVTSALTLDTSKKTYSLTLTDAVKGTDNLYLCLTMRGVSNTTKYCFIDKVWFE